MITKTDVQFASSVEQGVWRIDPTRSQIGFRTPMLWGLNSVEGRFERYEGALDLASEPAILLTIEAESIATGNRRRDEHLRSDTFFGVETHPHVAFVSERVELEDERLRVGGRLHAAGGSVPLEIEARLTQVGDELRITANLELDQRLLGMTYSPLGTVGAPTTLFVDGRLVRD